MPVQATSTTSSIQFTAPDQTWIIAPNVNAGAGLSSLRNGSTVVNYGNILYEIEAALFYNPDVLIYNKVGALIAGSRGIWFEGDQTEIHNEGTVVGISQHGIEGSNAANHVTIANSGSISGRLSGISISSASASTVSITNAGEITSDQCGVWLHNAIGAQPHIVNSGTIQGLVNAILAENGDRLDVTNSGALIGNVTGTSVAQTDTVLNNGTIAGDVRLGTGFDTYHGTGTVSGTVFGEDQDDTLSGGAAADRLNGGDGSDHISGGLGRDTLTGGLNSDFFIFNTAPNTTTNVDKVTDFNHVDDTFQLDNAVFKALGANGALKASFFFAGAAAHDADDHIIYNHATGALIYDSNGNAAGGAVQFAVLTTLKPVLAANDFVVI